jgi:hypothetical protein
MFGSLFKHLVVRRAQHVRVENDGGQVLFQPVVSSTYNTLMDCDFNGHKSNSTFYADLDVSRIQLIATLFKGVILPQDAGKKRATGAGLGRLNCLLGGVSCTFRREIKPLQRFEIWTRVLCWDEKW